MPERITRFSDAFILYVGAQVAAALHHAHSRADGEREAAGHRSSSPGPGMRRPHGNAYSSSPEALLGMPVDARSDLFQLGLTLYELATGAHPLDPPEGLSPELEETLSEEEYNQVSQAILEAKEVGLNETVVQELILRVATYTPQDLDQLVAKLSAREAAEEIGRMLMEAGEQLVGLDGVSPRPRRQRDQDGITTR